MGSIIGQAMQGAGPSLSALGSSIGSFFSPTAAAAGPSDTGLPSGAPGVPSAPIDLSATPASGAGPSLLPSAGAAPSTWGSGSAAPVPSLLPTDAGASSSGSPFGNITPPAVDASGNPIPPTPGGASPSWLSQIISAVTGKDPSKGGTGAFIGDVGNIGEAIQRYMVQQQLQNPSDILKQSQKLSGGLSKALKRNVGAATGQEMANAGLAGAPGLYSQAVASALAPYRYQQQQAALKDYLAAMEESMGAYPGTGGLYGPYGGYGSYPGEQQQTAEASPG